MITQIVLVVKVAFSRKAVVSSHTQVGYGSAGHFVRIPTCHRVTFPACTFPQLWSKTLLVCIYEFNYSGIIVSIIVQLICFYAIGLNAVNFPQFRPSHKLPRSELCQLGLLRLKLLISTQYPPSSLYEILHVRSGVVRIRPYRNGRGFQYRERRGIQMSGCDNFPFFYLTFYSKLKLMLQMVICSLCSPSCDGISLPTNLARTQCWLFLTKY